MKYLRIIIAVIITLPVLAQTNKSQDEDFYFLIFKNLKTRAPEESHRKAVHNMVASGILLTSVGLTWQYIILDRRTDDNFRRAITPVTTVAFGAGLLCYYYTWRNGTIEQRSRRSGIIAGDRLGVYYKF